MTSETEPWALCITYHLLIGTSRAKLFRYLLMDNRVTDWTKLAVWTDTETDGYTLHTAVFHCNSYVWASQKMFCGIHWNQWQTHTHYNFLLALTININPYWIADNGVLITMEITGLLTIQNYLLTSPILNPTHSLTPQTVQKPAIIISITDATGRVSRNLWICFPPNLQIWILDKEGTICLSTEILPFLFFRQSLILHLYSVCRFTSKSQMRPRVTACLIWNSIILKASS